MAKRSRAINKKQATLICAVLLVAVALIAWKSGLAEETVKDIGQVQSAAENDSGLRVSFVDVGQGDCILASCGGQTMLIDAGENGEEQTVINYIKQQGITRLDYVVATHPHSDHIGSLPEVLAEFEAVNIIMPSVPESITPTSSTYSAFLDAVAAEKAEGAKVISAKPGKAYGLGGATFKIVAPVDADVDDLNNISVVIRLDYGENSFLFTGDASSQEEKSILDSGENIDCDVLKVGHHGSKTSSTKDFLAAVTPEAAVIMCGRDNSYNHPNEAAVERLESFTDKIYRTDICSTIVVECDSSSYTVTY